MYYIYGLNLKPIQSIMQVTVTRKDIRFLPDPSRVIARFLYTSDERSRNIISNVLAMSDSRSKNIIKSGVERVIQDVTEIFQ